MLSLLDSPGASQKSTTTPVLPDETTNLLDFCSKETKEILLRTYNACELIATKAELPLWNTDNNKGYLNYTLHRLDNENHITNILVQRMFYFWTIGLIFTYL